MTRRPPLSSRDVAARRWLARLAVVASVLIPSWSHAHPLGNFSISQYMAIRVYPDAVELRYLIDLAEIPTFQEIQDTGLVPEIGHPGVRPYLARKVEALKEGLVLQVDGRRLPLHAQGSEVIFPPGAGDLPTMKLGVVYRAALSPSSGAPTSLQYQDDNFPDRAGWKEIIAVAGPGVMFPRTSVPSTDRSRELADYPTDLLNSPPQDRTAHLVFTREPPPIPAVGIPRRPSESRLTLESRPTPPPDRAGASSVPAPPIAAETPQAETPQAESTLGLRANEQSTPRNALTDLVRTRQLSPGIVAIALAIAAGLGAFHALEPGHGKTVVAAYLVGARGTAWHAVLLGLIVTASHTAGVYLLGAVTLYAARYVVPERLYPWLAVGSGVAIAIVGFTQFLRRYAGHGHPHSHIHDHAAGHHHHSHATGHHHSYAAGHDHPHGPGGHQHEPGDASGDPHHHHVNPGGTVTLAALVTLGVTGGIVPCPAALVVLLSSLALNRVGFGLLLIVAFSVGLAAVLIAVGMLMVYARRFMARWEAEGPLIQRWLPLTSSAVITVLGVAIAVQGLMTAGILHVRL